MLVKACLNGNRTPADHPNLPLSPQQLAADARKAVEAGAGALHIHPRLPDGSEALDAGCVNAAVTAVRDACPGIAVGVSTGAWIEPNLTIRKELVGSWRELPDKGRPDFASVNLSEDGALEVCAALLDASVGVEAGLWSRQDARLLLDSGFTSHCTRLLIELVQQQTANEARRVAWEIEETLEAGDNTIPILLHGEGPVAWAMLEYALERGYDARMGLEDTLVMPDGNRAKDNAELVKAALATYFVVEE